MGLVAICKQIFAGSYDSKNLGYDQSPRGFCPGQGLTSYPTLY